MDHRCHAHPHCSTATSPGGTPSLDAARRAKPLRAQWLVQRAGPAADLGRRAPVAGRAGGVGRHSGGDRRDSARQRGAPARQVLADVARAPDQHAAVFCRAGAAPHTGLSGAAVGACGVFGVFGHGVGQTWCAGGHCHHAGDGVCHGGAGPHPHRRWRRRGGGCAVHHAVFRPGCVVVPAVFAAGQRAAQRALPRANAGRYLVVHRRAAALAGPAIHAGAAGRYARADHRPALAAPCRGGRTVAVGARHRARSAQHARAPAPGRHVDACAGDARPPAGVRAGP